MYCYVIGDIGFGFDIKGKIIQTGFHDRFLVDEETFENLKDKHTFHISSGEEELELNDPIYKCDGSIFYTADVGYVKLSERFHESSFEIITIQNGNEGQIKVSNNGLKYIGTSNELFTIIDIAYSYIFYDAFILHGSVIEHNGKCIIFSGESGIGKSTQAELWRKYKNSKVLNGDRVLIRKIRNKWYAFGLPMCGSSPYCEKYKKEIEALVFLGKAKENRISIPSTFEKFFLVTGQIFCGTKRKKETEKLMDLIQEFIARTKILILECVPEESAVNELEKYLSDNR